jgi:TPR repeat protein
MVRAGGRARRRSSHEQYGHTLYSEGHGVPRNNKIAREWFEKAAALGIPEAKQNLKGMGR